MRTTTLSGQDLAYWVARANMMGSMQEQNVLRRHYGEGPSSHEPACEPAMVAFVAGKYGDELPARELWH